MKFALISVSICAASGATLRGADEAPGRQPLPLPDATCLHAADGTPWKNESEVCEQRVSSDGNTKCVWCQASGDDEGACISRIDARRAVEIMGVPCPSYTNSLRVDAAAAAAAAAAKSAPPDFNCFHAAWNGENAEATCGESKASDGSECVWCSLGGATGGACLSNDEAVAANGQFGLTCPLSIYIEPAEDAVENGIPDLNCFKAAWVAENAETACGESKDSEGNACVWCQTDGDVAGACLSRSEAGMANGQFGLTCPSSDEHLPGIIAIKESATN